MLVLDVIRISIWLCLFLLVPNSESKDLDDCMAKENELVLELWEEVSSAQHLLSDAIAELRSLEEETSTLTERLLRKGKHTQIGG